MTEGHAMKTFLCKGLSIFLVLVLFMLFSGINLDAKAYDNVPDRMNHPSFQQFPVNMQEGTQLFGFLLICINFPYLMHSALANGRICGANRPCCGAKQPRCRRKTAE